MKYNTITDKLLASDRMVQTLVISVLMVLGMGLLRPDKPQGISPSRFWMIKIRSQQCVDMVLAGDSRTHCSLSPTKMRNNLSDYRIINYGFAGNGYSSQYGDALKNLLDPKSNHPVIVLGITPSFFTPISSKTNRFLEKSSLSKRDQWIHYHLGSLKDFFEPMSFHDAWMGIFPKLKKSHTYREYHPDGWIGADKEPRSYKDSLRRSRAAFAKNKSSPKIINALIDRVDHWSGQGIKVFGFFPPTCSEIRKLEIEQSGFVHDDFIAKFKNSGGIWISPAQTEYASHDGSHMTLNDALRFSEDFSRQLVPHLSE